MFDFSYKVKDLLCCDRVDVEELVPGKLAFKEVIEMHHHGKWNAGTVVRWMVIVTVAGLLPCRGCRQWRPLWRPSVAPNG